MSEHEDHPIARYYRRCDERANALRDQAREARIRGDHEEARRLEEEALRAGDTGD